MAVKINMKLKALQRMDYSPKVRNIRTHPYIIIKDPYIIIKL